MSTLTFGMADHLAATEAFAHCARNAIDAGMLDVARSHVQTVIASLREAQASLAHERDITESRRVASKGLAFVKTEADD